MRAIAIGAPNEHPPVKLRVAHVAVRLINDDEKFRVRFAAGEVVRINYDNAILEFEVQDEIFVGPGESLLLSRTIQNDGR